MEEEKGAKGTDSIKEEKKEPKKTKTEANNTTASQIDKIHEVTGTLRST